MRAQKTLVPSLFLFATLLGVGVWTWAAGPGDPARLLPYTGHVELDGEPVDGPVSMTFLLYDDEDPGSSGLSWSESHQVNAAAGRFSVVLGETNPIPKSAFDAAALYLEIQVGSVVLGKQRVHAVADAQRAAEATFATSATHAATASMADNATHADTADNATHATTATVADALDCPNSNDILYGICVAHIPAMGNFEEGARQCAESGMHICSLAEMNHAYSAGYRLCSWGWASDWLDLVHGYRVLPSGGGVGCGSIGLQPTVTVRSLPYGVYCCR